MKALPALVGLLFYQPANAALMCNGVPILDACQALFPPWCNAMGCRDAPYSVQPSGGNYICYATLTYSEAYGGGTTEVSMGTITGCVNVDYCGDGSEPDHTEDIYYGSWLSGSAPSAPSYASGYCNGSCAMLGSPNNCTTSDDDGDGLFGSDGDSYACNITFSESAITCEAGGGSYPDGYTSMNDPLTGNTSDCSTGACDNPTPTNSNDPGGGDPIPEGSTDPATGKDTSDAANAIIAAVNKVKTAVDQNKSAVNEVKNAINNIDISVPEIDQSGVITAIDLNASAVTAAILAQQQAQLAQMEADRLALIAAEAFEQAKTTEAVTASTAAQVAAINAVNAQLVADGLQAAADAAAIAASATADSENVISAIEQSALDQIAALDENTTEITDQLKKNCNPLSDSECPYIAAANVASCDAPLAPCTGDPIQCAQLEVAWRDFCNVSEPEDEILKEIRDRLPDRTDYTPIPDTDYQALVDGIESDMAEILDPSGDYFALTGGEQSFVQGLQSLVLDQFNTHTGSIFVTAACPNFTIDLATAGLSYTFPFSETVGKYTRAIFAIILWVSTLYACYWLFVKWSMKD